LWDTRQPISDQQRLQFFLALSEQRVIAAGELGTDPSAALDHKDRSRLDRRALSAVLQQLGYLTLQRGKRNTRKPRRPTKEALAQRAARHGVPASEEQSAEGIARVLPPLLNHRPCVDNTRHSTSTATTKRTSAEKETTQVLALAARADTMQASSGVTADAIGDAEATASARGERTMTSWWRSSVTLLVPLLKAAKITR
jgi:hypothetical protein